MQRYRVDGDFNGPYVFADHLLLCTPSEPIPLTEETPVIVHDHEGNTCNGVIHYYARDTCYVKLDLGTYTESH